MIRSIPHSLEWDSSTVRSGPVSIRGGRVLIKNTHGLYPTSDPAIVRTRLLSASRVRAWVGIDLPVAESVGGTVDFRLSDGTTDYFYDLDTSEWVEAVDPDADWTIQADVQENIGSFPVGERKIGVVVRLQTTESLRTPSIGEITVLFDASVRSFTDEYVLDTLLARLKAMVFPEIDWSIKWGGGTTMDLSEYSPKNGYVISNIVEAYDYEGDPGQHADILSSFDTETKILTLSQALDEGKFLAIVFHPSIAYALSTHADYDEVSRLPAVVARQITSRFEHRSNSKIVTWVADGQGWKVRSPRVISITIPIDVFVDRISGNRIVEEIKELVQREPVVYSPGIGNKILLDVVSDIAYYPRADEETVVRSTIMLRMRGCAEFYFAKEPAHAITSFDADADTGA